MIPIYFNYSKFTLEEIDTYTHTDFECDGDKQEIKVIIHEKENKNESKIHKK